MFLTLFPSSGFFSGVFTDSLTPALDAFGLEGVFRIKEKQHEGPATFYRRSGCQHLHFLLKTQTLDVKLSHEMQPVVNSVIYLLLLKELALF